MRFKILSTGLMLMGCASQMNGPGRGPANAPELMVPGQSVMVGDTIYVCTNGAEPLSPSTPPPFTPAPTPAAPPAPAVRKEPFIPTCQISFDFKDPDWVYEISWPVDGPKQNEVIRGKLPSTTVFPLKYEKARAAIVQACHEHMQRRLRCHCP